MITFGVALLAVNFTDLNPVMVWFYAIGISSFEVLMWFIIRGHRKRWKEIEDEANMVLREQHFEETRDLREDPPPENDHA